MNAFFSEGRRADLAMLGFVSVPVTHNRIHRVMRILILQLMSNVKNVQANRL